MVIETFFKEHYYQLLTSVIILISLAITRGVINFTITKIARKNDINEARIRLIRRYITIGITLIAILLIAAVFGKDLNQIAVIFSSLFAVIGIGLFAIWSILSNITSGIIMFFTFPYKVGDKIEIMDKDNPIEAIIEDIGAFQLHLRLDNGNLVTYPNNLMLQKPVVLVKKDAIDDEIDLT